MHDKKTLNMPLPVPLFLLNREESVCTGISLAKWRSRLENPMSLRPAAIDCIELTLAFFKALYCHYQEREPVPVISEATLYFDCFDHSVHIGGPLRRPDLRRYYLALVNTLYCFFKFPSNKVVLNDPARQGLISALKKAFKLTPSLISIEQVVEELTQFKAEWKRMQFSVPISIAAYVDMHEYAQASESEKCAMKGALMAFHHVILVECVQADGEILLRDDVSVRHDLEAAGIPVHPDRIYNSAVDVMGAITQFEIDVNAYQNKQKFVFVSLQQRQPSMPHYLTVDPSIHNDASGVARYRRMLRLLLGLRAPPVLKNRWQAVRQCLLREKSRLQDKYVSDSSVNPIVMKRVEHISALIEAMQNKSSSPADQVWLDGALETLADEMKSVNFFSFFYASRGKKRIQALRESYWEDSTYLRDTTHLGFS